MKLALLYIILINVFTFFVYGYDKHLAKRGARRVPEKHLIGLALIGGSVGAWLGMTTFRHKTQHPKFTIGVPLILLAQVVLVVVLLFKGSLNDAAEFFNGLFK